MIANLRRFVAATMVATPAVTAAQTPPPPHVVTPAFMAVRGLPVRADTLDGFVGDRSARGYFGYYVYAVSRAASAGTDTYVVTMNYTGRANSGEHNFQSDTLVVDAKTLAPLWHRFHARTDSASLTYAGRSVTGWTHINGKRVQIDRSLSADAFDAGLNRWILSALPYAPGYRASWTTFSFWSNAEATPTVALQGGEALSMGGKTVDTWIVGANGGTRRWIAKANATIVQQEYPRNGGEASWEVKR